MESIGTSGNKNILYVNQRKSDEYSLSIGQRYI